MPTLGEMQTALMENSAGSLGEKCWDESSREFSPMISVRKKAGSRDAPDRRGELRKSRSHLVEVDIASSTHSSRTNSSASIISSMSAETSSPLPSPTPESPPLGRRKSGTLTFARSIGELKRAGSSREVGPISHKPLRRQPPARSQSCLTG